MFKKKAERDKVSQTKDKTNRQARRSMDWMLDALLLLLDEMPYDKISISAITEKAGVARQTFYRNYKSKDDIVLQYLEGIFSAALNMKNVPDGNNRNILVITLSFNRLIEHKQKMKKLLQSGAEFLIFTYAQKLEDYVTDFGKNKMPRMEMLIFRYMVKFQIGGSLRMIVDWLKHDTPIPAEKMGELMRRFIGTFEAGIGGIPSLAVTIEN
jgi:AcrR family transcriptional regulator